MVWWSISLWIGFALYIFVRVGASVYQEDEQLPVRVWVFLMVVSVLWPIIAPFSLIDQLRVRR